MCLESCWRNLLDEFYKNCLTNYMVMYIIILASDSLDASMREWLSGGAPPCQGGGRGFDPRLALQKKAVIPNGIAAFFSSPILDSKVRCLALLKSGSVGSVEQRSTGPLLSAAKARQAKNVLAQFFICRAQEQREALLRDVRLRNRACSITAGADFPPHPSRA